jgi:pimeloyl-ACP methyl ester carboxylesterase
MTQPNYPVYTYPVAAGQAASADSPTLHFALANGFPPETYIPLLAPFANRYTVKTLLPRPLWLPTPPPAEITHWQTLADDLLAALAGQTDQPVIGMGHSLGGVITSLAALRQPQKFRALVLLDPTFLSPTVLRMITVLKPLGFWERYPVVQKAIRRRSNFPDTATAYQYFKSKPLFRDWPSATVQQYAESGLVQQGDGYTLRWSSAWEAQMFRTIYLRTWSMLPALRRTKLPTLVLQGQISDTFTAPAAKRLRQLWPEATLVQIPEQGHLFPMSAPELAVEAVSAWLRGLGLP